MCIDTNFRKYVLIRFVEGNHTTLPRKMNIRENTCRYELPEMNDSMIIIFGNDNKYLIGRSADNQHSHSEENICIMSQYACSWTGLLGGYPP